MLYRAIILLCLITGIISDEVKSPKIIIVGAGAAGIAAASKLLENGFENVLILEAEDRIGGRINTVEFDNYLVDLGAQWVHGEKGNVANDLATPLGLTDHGTSANENSDLYYSSGLAIDPEVTKEYIELFRSLSEESPPSREGRNDSMGDYFTEKYTEFFSKHPEINETLQQELLKLADLIYVSGDPAESWYDVTVNSEYHNCEGDLALNWKDQGYRLILDILMKKLPNPEDELPVLNKTIFNAEVTKVDHTNEDNTVKITTLDGKEYVADHVIITPSLGVLKAQHETLFDPALPESKINTIKGLGFGTVSKIILAFNEPWWGDKPQERSGFTFLKTENENKELASNPETKWMVGLFGFYFVEYKPRILLGWVSGEGARLTDSVSDELMLNQTMHMLNEYLSQDYNITQPTAMIRSKWNGNKHFRGTYSYHSMETIKTNSSNAVLAEPIMKMDKPVVLFAGEATNTDHHFSTVHGAIETGWREADRLINLYNKNKN